MMREAKPLASDNRLEQSIDPIVILLPTPALGCPLKQRWGAL
jgi:hypothetical protein